MTKTENMLTDKNKGITTAITYNYLNLPALIPFVVGSQISYLYDASGNKLTKSYTAPGTSIPVTTDYIGDFVYSGQGTPVLQYFGNDEDYASYNAGTFSYVYQYKDHLGNVRMSYVDTNNDGNYGKDNKYIL